MHEVIHFILLPYNEYISFKLKAISIIKVVDMWVNGKYHRLNWMSKEGQANLIDELEKDYLLNNSVIRKKKVVNPPIVGIPTK